MSPRVIYLEILILLWSFFTFTVSFDKFVTDHDQLSNVDVKDCSVVSPDERLPINKTWPMRYTLNLAVNPSHDRVVGTTTIMITVENPTRYISLHAYGLDIFNNEIKLKNADAASTESYTFIGYRYCSGSQILDLRFQKIIVPGVYNLAIHFAAPYSSRYGIVKYQYSKNNATFDKETRLIATVLEPNGARRVFPCWDEPGIKAIFNISVRHPKEYEIFSNMHVIAYGYVKIDNYVSVLTHFADTFPISASHVLIALYQNNLIYTEINVVDKMWYRPEVKTLQYAMDIFQYKEIAWYFVTDIPLLENLKGDYIFFPNNTFNTIGCLGLIINREKDFLYDIRFDFPGRRLYVTEMVTRTIAREWFMGMITPSWWSDLWLGESLAKFYSHYIMDEILSDDELTNLNIVKTFQTTLYYDINLRMKAISAYSVQNADEIDKCLYSSLYYNKGFILIRMLKHVLTKQKFEKAMWSYFKQYMLRSITANDFWTALQRVYDDGKNENVAIKDIMNTWLTERYYPHDVYYRHGNNRTGVLFLSRSYDNSTLKWKIPISYVTRSTLSSYDSLNVIWLNHSQNLIIRTNDPYDFVIINTKQSGYYRVNYDDKTWWNIANYLNYDNYNRIHVLNRAQLIDDAFYFMMKGDITSSTFWELAKYLRHETNYVAWYPMFNILSYIGSYWDYLEASYFKKNVLEILDGLLLNIGYEGSSHENTMQEALRLLATRWACKLGHMECRLSAGVKLFNYMKNPLKHSLAPWWKDWLFCAGMTAADKNTWEELFREYIDTKNPDILKYLYCSDDEQNILHYLELLISYMIREEALINKEFSNIFYGIVRKHIMKNAVLQHILQRYITIKYGLHGNAVDINMLGSMIMNVHLDEQFNMITEFAQKIEEIDMSKINFLKQVQKQRIRNFNVKYYNL